MGAGALEGIGAASTALALATPLAPAASKLVLGRSIACTSGIRDDVNMVLPSAEGCGVGCVCVGGGAPAASGAWGS